MIELCTVKRMAMIGASLIVLCLIVLGLENALTTKNSPGTTAPSGVHTTNLTGKEYCWRFENYSIKEECHECSNFEKISGHLPACQQTGFKELISCEKTGDIHKSCPRLPWMEKRNFWLFEFSMVIVGLFSWITVFLRRKQLDLKTLQRIQKQISAGV